MPHAIQRSPYLALFTARFRTLIQYREAAIAGMATQLFWGLIKVMILEAFYKSATHTPPMSLAQVITYTWLGQAFLAMLPFTANPDPDVRNMIRTGAVAYELARPLDLYSLWFARQVAARTAPTLLRCIPLFLIAVPFLGMALPPSVFSGGAAILSLLGALLLTCSFMTIVTTSLLWTVSGDGIARLAPSVVLIGCGLIIPLPLFPSWLQPLLTFLPFSGMADTPFRLYGSPSSLCPGRRVAASTRLGHRLYCHRSFSPLARHPFPGRPGWLIADKALPVKIRAGMPLWIIR